MEGPRFRIAGSLVAYSWPLHSLLTAIQPVTSAHACPIRHPRVTASPCIAEPNFWHRLPRHFSYFLARLQVGSHVPRASLGDRRH